MLTDDYQIKLIDFGLSIKGGWIFDSLIKGKIFAGAIPFISPETYHTERLGYNSIHSDVYSLGLIMAFLDKNL